MREKKRMYNEIYLPLFYKKKSMWVNKKKCLVYEERRKLEKKCILRRFEREKSKVKAQYDSLACLHIKTKNDNTLCQRIINRQMQEKCCCFCMKA